MSVPKGHNKTKSIKILRTAFQESNQLEVTIKDRNNIVVKLTSTSVTFFMQVMVKLASKKTSGPIHKEVTSKADIREIQEIQEIQDLFLQNSKLNT